MKPTPDEVDSVIAGLENACVLEDVLQIRNDLAQRGKIKLDEEPLLVPFESYEALYVDLQVAQGQRDVFGNTCFRLRLLCMVLAFVVATLLAAMAAELFSW